MLESLLPAKPNPSVGELAAGWYEVKEEGRLIQNCPKCNILGTYKHKAVLVGGNPGGLEERAYSVARTKRTFI